MTNQESSDFVASIRAAALQDAYFNAANRLKSLLALNDDKELRAGVRLVAGQFREAEEHNAGILAKLESKLGR